MRCVNTSSGLSTGIGSVLLPTSSWSAMPMCSESWASEGGFGHGNVVTAILESEPFRSSA